MVLFGDAHIFILPGKPWPENIYYSALAKQGESFYDDEQSLSAHVSGKCEAKATLGG